MGRIIKVKGKLDNLYDKIKIPLEKYFIHPDPQDRKYNFVLIR
jgi:hypothetical protein